MVVCKYYLDGRCQYGNKCRYDHVDQSGSNRSRYDSYQSRSKYEHRVGSVGNIHSNYPSPPLAPVKAASIVSADPSRFKWVAPQLRRQSSSSAQEGHTGPATSANVNVAGTSVGVQSRHRSGSSGHVTDEASLLARVRDDLTEWRESAQWPFSSYGLKGLPSIFGFKDLSCEELRVRAYAARDAKKMDSYETEVKNLVNAVRMRWTQLFSLSPENKEEMLAALRPYVASPKSAITLAQKTDTPIGQDTQRPSFSFKTQPTAAIHAGATDQPKPLFSFKSQANSVSTLPSVNRAQQEKQIGPAGFSFKSTTAPSDSVLKTVNQQQQQPKKSAIYSEIGSLTSDELIAFKANQFQSYNDIPMRPPPKELC